MARTAPVHQPSGFNTDSWRDGKTTAQRGYGGRWQRARLTFLSRPENVLCRMCEQEGTLTPATVVDHVIPHKGDQALFWDTSNWQPLCKTHHDRDKQRADRARAGGG
ncbi:HNH endonuclease [Lysobacter sp. F6437]|uniref:HNH endonuclease n=1 Tax=Lysobacter sp. F6437 TaxID=3459296 RepID=UPI00403D9CBC